MDKWYYPDKLFCSFPSRNWIQKNFHWYYTNYWLWTQLYEWFQNCQDGRIGIYSKLHKYEGLLLLFFKMKNQHNFIFSVYIQFLAYDSKDEVVRYSLTSLIKDQLDDSDPCQSVNCPRNSFCILESNSQNAQCQCNQGFISMGTSSDGSDTKTWGDMCMVLCSKINY